MGTSKEETDFWGNKVTVHYDDDGNKSGTSKMHEPGFFESLGRGSTEPYEKHFDADGNPAGSTETHDPGFFESLGRGSTRPYEKHFDAGGNPAGSTESHDPGFFESLHRGSTESYERHYGPGGEYTGYTERHRPGFFESLASGSTRSYERHFDAGGRPTSGSRSHVSGAAESARQQRYRRESAAGIGASPTRFPLAPILILAAVILILIALWSGHPTPPPSPSPSPAAVHAAQQARAATIAEYNFAAWPVGFSKRFARPKSFKFCTRPCNYGASSGVAIALTAITRSSPDRVSFEFSATTGPHAASLPGGFKNRYTSDFLLFVYDDVVEQVTSRVKSVYAEPFQLVDADGRKYKSTTGIEGLAVTPFNNDAMAALLPFGRTSQFRVSFPIPSRPSRALTLVSPALHGHQDQWSWRLYNFAP